MKIKFKHITIKLHIANVNDSKNKNSFQKNILINIKTSKIFKSFNKTFGFTYQTLKNRKFRHFSKIIFLSFFKKPLMLVKNKNLKVLKFYFVKFTVEFFKKPLMLFKNKNLKVLTFYFIKFTVERSKSIITSKVIEKNYPMILFEFLEV